jgi:hypothetical protein
MSKRTMRLVRTLSDIKPAQRCTALRAAAKAAELAALAAEPNEPEPPPAKPDAASKPERRDPTEIFLDYDPGIRFR